MTNSLVAFAAAHEELLLQINPVTVVGMVRESKVQKGGWLIQAAASSVLGRQVIALCKHQGIKTINIVRRDSAKQEILDAGYVRTALRFRRTVPCRA